MTQKQKILIVDDDKSNLRILSLILESDYEIQEANDGEEALLIAEKFKPDIMLLDVMMPGIDGIEVCQRIREDVNQRDCKIILVTAKTSLEDRLTGYDAGADDYITKPFEEDELQAKIRVFVRLNKEERKRQQLTRRLLLRQQDIPNMLWDCDHNFRFTHVGEAAKTILGYAPEAMIGKSMVEFIAQEEVGEFFLKFGDDLDGPKTKIHGLTFTFLDADGRPTPLQVFADRTIDDFQTSDGMVGIFRDMSDFEQLVQHSTDVGHEMQIRIDSQFRLVFVTDTVQKFMSSTYDAADPPDLLQYLTDPALKELISFAFDQKEDVPFPIEIELIDDEQNSHHLTAHLKFISDGPWLEGELEFTSANDQLGLVSKKMKSQNQTIQDQGKALESMVTIDADMQESILTDAQNMSAEILALVKALEPFAFPDDVRFDLGEYDRFLLNRNLQVYNENLRLLGNKIHGLKGSCGFLMAEAKQLCHQMEDITRPLAENKLVLTQTISSLMKQFVFKIEDMLEQFQGDSDVKISVDDWLEKIEKELKKAVNYIGTQVEDLANFIEGRSSDNGEIRQRKKEEYLSVSFEGYEILAEKVKDLYYTLSESLGKEQLVQAGNMYNQFLNTHQQIKKVPLNLSRYERLIPKLAEEYEKSADFVFIDHQIKADREFWNAIHEILNHVLKNAVIHGLEEPDQRTESGKEATGKVTVELNEDAMHILLTVSDDGRGINVGKIADKALEEGLITQERHQSMDEDEKLSLLFLQGVSTVTSLDDNAGRGVGMNAVQEAIHQLQGECQIQNEPGSGCSYHFSFLKSNVSLPCIIIALDDLNLAIPEDYVDSFIDYKPESVVTVNQNPTYRYNDSLIPLIDSKSNFKKDAASKGDKASSVIILRNGVGHKGMIINGILHHAILPILPLPKIYREVPIYQGITIYNNSPIQVLNVDKLN